MDIALLKKAAQVINNADSVLITAGAGIGVDSGLPDFRGDEGFWRAYHVAQKLGFNFANMANPKLFYALPELAWGFYGHRYNMYKNTTPHSGFSMLLEIVKSKGNENYFIVTSNVDGAFQKAGFDEQKIYECHGSINHSQCLNACSDDIWLLDKEQIDIDEQNLLAHKPLPKCKHCKNIARPNILMFEDFDWISNRSDTQYKRYKVWLERKSLDKKSVVVIEIGAGTAIPTIRHISENAASRKNGMLIRINPNEAKVKHNWIGIEMSAKDALSVIYKHKDT